MKAASFEVAFFIAGVLFRLDAFAINTAVRCTLNLQTV
jgi:hypothetical protein